MKQILVTAIIISFTGIAVFGFYTMHHGENEANCIAVASQGGIVPCHETGTTKSASFHLNAFRSFLSVVFTNENAAFPVLFVLLFIIAAGFMRAILPAFWAVRFVKISNINLTRAEKKKIHWLSLNENSPNFV